MRRYLTLSESQSRPILDHLEQAENTGENPVAWYFDLPREPQPIAAAARVHGLATFWAEARANFAYWERLTDLDWDAAFRRFLPRVQGEEDPAAYYELLREFAALLRDGHSWIVLPPWLAAQQGRPNLRLYPVEGEPTVLGGEGLPPGSVILRVDGEDAAARMARLQPREHHATPHDLQNRLVRNRLLAGPVATPAQVTARLPDGQVVEVQLPRLTTPPAPPLLERIDLGAGRVLVRINSWGQDRVVDEFHAAFPDFAHVRALVIDLRQNGGGNSSLGMAVLARLVDREVAGGVMEIPFYAGALSMWNLPQPMLTHAYNHMVPDAERPRYSGPVAVLTSNTTYSAAEDFCLAFRASGRGPLVGEVTGGSTGQPVLFPLPGGGAGAICSVRSYFADGSAFVGTGIRPDVAAAPTRAGVAAGRDEVLEQALSALGV